MPAQLTTRAQVNGYRFLLRRLDHAMVRRDVRMLHDPMRSQSRSLIIGGILGMLGVAGCVILSFIHPQGSVGKASIIVGKDSAALFVMVKDKSGNQTLHPALNLASARLISGTAETPTSVKDSKLSSYPRGPLLGIPGAPNALPGTSQGDHSDWSLCESVTLTASGNVASAAAVTTTVIAGPPELGAQARTASQDEAVLVSHDDKTYLIYDGKRAEIDPTNTVMARTLNLVVHPARATGTGLLDVAVPVPPLAPPTIPDAGHPGPGKLSNVPVGGVISVASADGSGTSDLYVVLEKGVQRIGPFVAQLIRNADSHGMSEIKSVPPDVLDGITVLDTLPLEQFPTQVPKIIGAEDDPVTCVRWNKSSGMATDQPESSNPTDRAWVSLVLGTKLPLGNSDHPVKLATSSGTGDHVDQVFVKPMTGEFVQTTGMDSGSLRRDSLFYITDDGIRYGIPDLATAEMLGLGKTPHLAPWAIVGQLVPGPTLSRTSALVSYDSVPTGPSAATSDDSKTTTASH
ncbi:type VII secretion protein EccB [Nocardia macrotermitis]|uniref:ESX-3 secretion system ATPase EccB3 n=1 Tax=Nocardia macrotermitis TaxID=2585198 RepID=A0A7K0D1I3_9NOCA|nr:type VII secretion protein EccB [Nocardia macrotermitis]MQY19558.1 ESX-3 secretion system ATPase EccB3 [Nocardia macrotermitis]